jgi:eukaryotic-like serine/threonine-protein kinase
VSLLEEMVLAEDVEIFPVADVPDATRATIPHAAGDFAISRPRARTVSRVIGKDARELLREFQQPTRIVDAILRYATARGIDPDATLDGAYPMLARLYGAQLLVSTAQRDADRASPRLAEGMEAFGVVLGRRVHAMDDTDVFCATDAAGLFVAVKVFRAGLDAAEREATAMRTAGPRAPEVRAVDAWQGSGIVVSEWVLGEDAGTAAAALRGQREIRSETALLELCCDVAGALAEVHDAGVVHGDVHPHNVLIEAGGRARLIDFGLARVAGAAEEIVGRGGVAFYFEPELASAIQKGESIPATAAGEQYALGALLYSMWTGAAYVDWSLERTTMLRQIQESLPVPFARRHVPEWPALEAIFHRALAKAPAARFASCAALASELRALLPLARVRDEAAVRIVKPSRDLVRALLERAGVGGPLFRDGPVSAPYASLNYGAAGITYALYKIAIARDDADLLATADVWARKTELLAREDGAFHAAAAEIDEESAAAPSLFHAPPGVHAVRALVALACGERSRAAPALADFLTASRVPCAKLDLTTGKASLLLGCAELLDAVDGCSAYDPADLVARGDALRDELAHIVTAASFATNEDVPFLGIAHGWAGLLFALLRWSQARACSGEPYRAKLDELAALREPHGAGIRWPIHNATGLHPAYMDGWCNGAAGHALLWALAHERLGVAEYAVHAERSATSAWSTTAKHGTICCGLAGIGYACAAAHRVTGDPAWLARARLAARRACEDRSEPRYVDSLYKGALGATLLQLELDAGCPATPFLERSSLALQSTNTLVV